MQCIGVLNLLDHRGCRRYSPNCRPSPKKGKEHPKFPSFHGNYLIRMTYNDPKMTQELSSLSTLTLGQNSIHMQLYGRRGNSSQVMILICLIFNIGHSLPNIPLIGRVSLTPLLSPCYRPLCSAPPPDSPPSSRRGAPH